MPKNAAADTRIVPGMRSFEQREIAALQCRSNSAAAWRLTCHAGSLVCVGWGICHYQHSPLACTALVVVQGALFAGLFAPLHECIHRTAFRSRWMNEVVAWFAGFATMLGPNAYRYFHFEHHRHTQNPQLDPELMGRPLGWPGRWPLAQLVLMDLTGLSVLQAFFMHAKRIVGRMPKLYPDHLRFIIRLESLLFVTGYVGLVFAAGYGVRAMLWAWLLPMPISRLLLHYWWMSEHTGCATEGPMEHRTRTTQTMGIVRFFMWNMPYHTEHHCFPSVPFHRLPVLHERLGPKLPHLSPGYLALLRRVRNEAMP